MSAHFPPHLPAQRRARRERVPTATAGLWQRRAGPRPLRRPGPIAFPRVPGVPSQGRAPMSPIPPPRVPGPPPRAGSSTQRWLRSARPTTQQPLPAGPPEASHPNSSAGLLPLTRSAAVLFSSSLQGTPQALPSGQPAEQLFHQAHPNQPFSRLHRSKSQARIHGMTSSLGNLTFVSPGPVIYRDPQFHQPPAACGQHIDSPSQAGIPQHPENSTGHLSVPASSSHPSSQCLAGIAPLCQKIVFSL